MNCWPIITLITEQTVDWQAQSPSDAQLRAAESATQAARQRALLNPQSTAGAAAASGQSQSVDGKISSPRQSFAASKAAIQQQQQQQQLRVPQPSAAIAQLQEPFEQIRQVELKGRARKSRHAPFYLLTV